MPKIRVEKKTNYTTIDNNIFKNKNLSLKARGLLVTMLSLPDEWDYTVNGLCSILKDGKTSIQSALKELENNGYLVRTQTRDTDGKFSCTDYTLYEIPLDEKPSAENQLTENQSQLNTNILNKEKLNTNFNKVFSNEKTIYNNKVSPTGETYRSPDIPYDYTEEEFKDFITKKTDHILHGISPEEKYASVKPISAIISYFYKRYYECIGERHPILTDMVYAKIIMKLLDPSDEVYRRGFCLDEMAYSAMIDKFFQTDYGVKSGNFTDYRMPYFMQDTVQNNLVYSAGVV